MESVSEGVNVDRVSSVGITNQIDIFALARASSGSGQIAEHIANIDLSHSCGLTGFVPTLKVSR